MAKLCKTILQISIAFVIAILLIFCKDFPVDNNFTWLGCCVFFGLMFGGGK